MATVQLVLPIDEILKKLEGLEKRHPSPGSAGQNDSSPTGRTTGSHGSQKGKGESQGFREEIQKEKFSETRRPSTGLTPEMENLPVERMINPEDSKKEFEDGGISQDLREETWRELVDYTRARNPILGAFLGMGNLVTINEEKIEIGFEKASFHYERMLEKENRSQLESICHEYLKRKAKVVISPMDQKVVLKGRGEVGPEGSPPNELEEGKAIKGGQEHPLIEEALRLFGGRIVKR